MGLNRKQKAYGGVLILGLTVLAVDQLSSSPQAALAETAADASATADTSVAPQIAGSADNFAAESAARRVIAQKLSEFAETRDLDPTAVPNVFQSSWSKELEAPVVTPADNYQLTAVMGAGSLGVAIVNGRTIRMGQELDGMRLTSVDARSATFEFNGRTVTMVVPQNSLVEKMSGSAETSVTPTPHARIRSEGND